MKKTAKKLLSMALVLVMVLSLLPAVTVPTLAADDDTDDDTKDAFGITMAEWTAEEKAEAEANLPFGTGYGTWTTLLEKNELFFSMGYDSATRLTGLLDWNGANIVDKVDNFAQSQLTSRTENYKAVVTAAMDLYGTGKKEYVANLALNASGNTLYLYVTDSKNNRVGMTQFEFENVAQLSGLQVHQLNGAFSIAAGDFDGDGKDTIVVYVPQTDSDKNTKNGTSPFIAEFSVSVINSGGLLAVSYVKESTVAANVLTLLGNTDINKIDKLHNQPMVDLVAEDVDKDGFDELIVTAGMNDVTSSDTKLGSQLFIYDKKSDNSWNTSYSSGEIQITDNNNKRIVWAGSSVGNIMVSTSTGVDYPEIVTAGFIDGETKNKQHINVDGSDDIGVSVVKVKSVTNKETKNVICQYEKAFDQKLSPNSWTKGGFYESEDVNGLLQVQAYADRGPGSAEAVFISGSVYRINNNGDGLDLEYKHDGFDGKDDFAGAYVLTNTTVTAVTAGNFDGNDEGREQLICVTCMKQSGKNNAYSQVYYYYNEATLNDDGTWDNKPNSKRSSYLTEHKGNFYVSLAALDTDDDSILVKLEEISRGYSRPDVLAILGTAPYFGEIEDSFGNSETTYGLSSSVMEGASNEFGFTLGASVGYEFESSLTQSGAGFELSIDRAFNWGIANSTTETWMTEFRNDSGENLVVVYRCPVVTYRYVDQDGKELVVEKVGQPATSMITVDEYNEAAAQYDGLDLIDNNIIGLGDPGDPASYRSNTQGLTNAVQYAGMGNASSNDTTAGWAQYTAFGSTMQGLIITEEQEKTFSTDLAVSLNVFAKAGGVTVGATYGFTYAHTQTHIDGSEVTKSCVVNSAHVDGYDFQWKFAAWDCTLNGSTVPVIGYLVKDVVAPPSPGEGLTAESITTDSITLRWSSGIREADQYRIYRVLDTSAVSQVLVGAVQGDQTSFTLTGLKPGETYTYVVRGVSYLNGESVNSAPITVRTQSEGSTVQLKLVGASLTSDNTLQSTGAEASLSAQVSGISGGSISYQWQLLETDTEGLKNGWRTVSDLPSTAIGTVTGAKSGTLTLGAIDKSLNGAYLRCVVTVTSTAGDIETYYSPIVTLDLNGLTTTTTVAVAGQTGVSGSITDPYTGLANYTAITEETSYSYVQVPATIKDGDGKEYTIYKDATQNVYVGVCDEVDTTAGASSRTYRAVTQSGDSYALGDPLTLSADQYLTTDDSSAYDTANLAAFDGVSTVSETVGNVTYVEQYAVAENGLTAYWLNTKDGLYYTKSVEGETVSFVQAATQPVDADLRGVYYESDSLLVLDAAELTETVGENNTVVVSSEYDRYEVYTKPENAGAGEGEGEGEGEGAGAGAGEGEASFTLDKTIYRVPGTKLCNGAAEYADSAKLEAVTVEQEVSYTTPVSTPVNGDQITLSAVVTDKNGAAVSTSVLYTITNTDTGAVTQITTNNGTATWTAPKYGLYRVVATAAATTATKSSSAECYYRAEDPCNDYRLIVKQNDKQVTNISYNASPVTLELEKRVYDSENQTSSWQAAESNVSYKVNNTTCSSSYTPNAAGNYLFSALVDGKLVASSVLAVSKVAITVTPTWERAGDATNTVPNYSDITLVVTDAQGRTLSSPSLSGIMKVSCSLYDSNGKLAADAKRGVYTVTPAYVSDTAKTAFLSRYSVTLNTDNIYYISDAITVYFNAGENGEVYARYIDPSGTEFAFDNGSQISMDYRLKFVAEPADGWFVGNWTVMLGEDPVDSSWYGSYTSRYSNTLEITSSGMEALDSSGQKEITVSATFTDQTHQITYSAGDNEGSLRAVTGTSQLTNGAFVAHNATVAFTAEPNTGKMVEMWTVDGAEYKWDGTDALYRENTLILENISADHDVQVFFTDEAFTNVIATAEDKDTAIFPGAAVTVTDAQGNTIAGNALGSVPQSSALTFTVEIDNTASGVVKEWQTSPDGTNWTTVTGSGGQNAITVYEHGETLYVRVVIAVAQIYQLSWKVMEGETEITDTSIANLVVMSGDVTLGGNGSNYAVNTPVEFSLWQLADSYYVVGWSDNVTPAADGYSATMTLTDNTDVTVTVAKKPIISWDDSITGGTITVKGTVNGTANADVNNGSYVDPDTDLTVTLSPDKGYEVGTISGQSPVYTDEAHSDEMSYTITGVQANQTITPSWKALDFSTITYSVVDINGSADGGTNGSLTASVDRKGMSDYAVTNDKGGTETVYRDSVVTFTATPDSGYKIGKWFVNGTEQSTAPTLTITDDAPDNQTVQVQFDPVGEQVTYGFSTDTDSVSSTVHGASLSAVYQANGSTERDNFPSGNKPTANGVITFTVSDLADGYEVEGWYVNGLRQDGETGETYTYSVTANVGAEVLVKVIRSSYTVTFSDSVNGSVSATVDGNAINSGDSVVGDTEVVFIAAPADATGYTFAGWTVDGAASEETTESLTLTITEDTVVKAIYTRDEVRYTVTYGVIGENGTLSARKLGADNTAAAGSSVVFTATPAAGYRVKGWYSNADGTTDIPGTTFEQNSYTLENLLANAGVYVAFELIPTYDITVTVTGLGNVTATVNGEEAEITGNTLTVTRYDDVVLTATPDTYQYLTGWTLDSEDQGNGSMTLTLADVTEAHTVAADFAASQLVEFRTVCGENGSLTAQAGYGEPLSTIDASTGISLEKGKKVVVTAAPANGYMVAQWTVNGTAVTRDNMAELGVTLGHYLSNTLTVENLSEAMTIQVSFKTYTGFPIPTGDTGYTVTGVERNPNDTTPTTEIRENGDLSFIISPDSEREYSTISSIKLGDKELLTDDPNDNITVVKNSNGSYTVTITGVQSALNLAVTAHKLVITSGLDGYEPPQALKNAGFADNEAIQTELDTVLTGSSGNRAYYDIALKYYDGSYWVEVTDAANFPANGVDVVLPYPDGTDSKDTFTIVHMLTTGDRAGETEIVSYTKEADGLHFHVDSLSPFGVSWTKYVAPSGGGGGGSVAVPTETVTIQDSVNGKVTADNTCAKEGDTVTLTVEPDKGYTPETLTVTDKNGDELELKDNGDGKYTFTMPASNITVKATFMEDNSMLNFFVDVPADAYYYDAVLWAAKEGITGGTDAVHFSPNATCTRAQAVTFLWRAAGSPAPTSSVMTFTDVAEGSYYETAVLWAVENGITNGTGDGTTFSPDADCTRAQIVTFLWRSQESPDAGAVNPFTDVAADAYYADAVLWAVENGITTGTADTTFSPNNDCTRAQIVTFLYRCMK